MGRDHVVSRGYLRLFADGERIRLIQKDAEWSKVVGTRDAFVEPRFNTLTAPGLSPRLIEDEWTRLEGDAVPALRRVCDGEFDESLAVEVRVLMALHIARSYRLKRLFDDVVGGDDQIADVVERALKNRTARAGYQRQFGKPMTREAIEELARAARNDMTEGNRLWVERLSDVYNKALSFLARWHVQVVRVRRRAYGFMTGDSPVVVADKHRQRVGLALGGAGFVFMPIGRFTGATMTSQPLPEAELDPRVVQELNTLMRRNCIRHLACHPDDDWRRSLGLAPLK